MPCPRGCAHTSEHLTAAGGLTGALHDGRLEACPYTPVIDELVGRECEHAEHAVAHHLRGKTVAVRLTEEEAEHIREWIENGRKLDRIVAEMEKLSLRMTDRLLRQLKPA